MSTSASEPVRCSNPECHLHGGGSSAPRTPAPSSSATPEPPAQPAPVARIPLTITVAATGEQTKGVLVAVMAADLDALEAKIASQEELGTSFCAALAEGETINARLAAALEAAERSRDLLAEAHRRRLCGNWKPGHAYATCCDHWGCHNAWSALVEAGIETAEGHYRSPVRAALSGTGGRGAADELTRMGQELGLPEGQIKDATEEGPGSRSD